MNLASKTGLAQTFLPNSFLKENQILSKIIPMTYHQHPSDQARQVSLKNRIFFFFGGGVISGKVEINNINLMEMF